MILCTTFFFENKERDLFINFLIHFKSFYFPGFLLAHQFYCVLPEFSCCRFEFAPIDELAFHFDCGKFFWHFRFEALIPKIKRNKILENLINKSTYSNLRFLLSNLFLK